MVFFQLPSFSKKLFSVCSTTVICIHHTTTPTCHYNKIEVFPWSYIHWHAKKVILMTITFIISTTLEKIPPQLFKYRGKSSMLNLPETENHNDEPYSCYKTFDWDIGRIRACNGKGPKTEYLRCANQTMTKNCSMY